MLPFFAGKIFSISFFISLDFYLQVLLLFKIIYAGETSPKYGDNPTRLVDTFCKSISLNTNSSGRKI